jgi:N-acetyl-1-D-myo-inositol-2-amino-2-deoxy-alpha-D-glucopyranoside deacetylase
MSDETTTAPEGDPAPAPHRPTLMTVHAHPDDETIGTGGTMAKAVEAGYRVILVTGTRGELGEIVVPEMDTADNHRRLSEIRAGELERAMAALGVTEWENLGYRDSGMMGTDGNRDPRSYWQADLDEAAGRLVWLVRRYQPDVMTTYNAFGGYGHPDHIRTHDVAIRAFERAGDRGWYPEQFEEPGLEPWAPSKLYEQAFPASAREKMNEKMRELGQKPFWAPPDDATPEQIAEMEAFAAKMLVPDDQITTWVDVSGAPLEAKWKAIHEHVTQISDQSPFMLMGADGMREAWGKEAYILRESRIKAPTSETDLFAGIV